MSKYQTRQESITFKVHEDTILSAPGLALADNDSRHDLLPEIRLSLLDCGHDHISNAGGREPIEAALDSLHRDDVKVLRTRVVGAVHGCRHGETQRHPELVSGGPSATCKFHRNTNSWRINQNKHYFPSRKKKNKFIEHQIQS